MTITSDDAFIIPNYRHVPLYSYDPKNDDTEEGFVVFHSKKYLRRQKKLNEKRRATKRT